MQVDEAPEASGPVVVSSAERAGREREFTEKQEIEGNMNRKQVLISAALGLSGFAAQAFPIAAPGTEGYLVIVAGTDPVVATYEGNSAGYDNDLYLEKDALGNPGMDGDQSNDVFIFNNHISPVGSIANLGSFTAGTELVFRLYVQNTGDNFYSGPATRNPDGMAHARVQNNWLPAVTLVSFEDLYGTPEGVNGYNDLSFSFSNTRGQQAPEPLSTGLWLGLVGLAGAALARRRQA
jgi:MYXO-CTERM domain-containing protein